MAEMSVELVAVERRVWSGRATMVRAKTTVGELGILPGHAELLGELTDGVVQISTPENETISVAVFGGFLSVTKDKVSVLAEAAELAEEIDIAAARAALQEADGDDAEQAAVRRSRAVARLRAAGEDA